MKDNKIRKIITLAYVVCVMLVSIGCTTKEEETGIVENKIEISKGAFINEAGDTIFNFTNEDNVEKLDTDNKIINNFNKASNTYTFFKDGSYYVNYNFEDIKINHNRIFNLKISPDGQFVFYFVNDDYLKPTIMDLKEKKEIEIQNKAIISGQFIDWFTDEKLAYYGVDNENKVSGIFTYNILNNDEEMLYKVDSGYVEFLKYIKNGIAFVQEHFGEEASLKIIDENNNVIDVCEDIMEISDVEFVGESIFILGRMKNNSYSIYEVKDKKITRVNYDFPKNIHIDKGLSVNEKDELLFAGSNDDDKIDNIYKYSDESISLIFEGFSKYNFINVE